MKRRILAKALLPVFLLCAAMPGNTSLHAQAIQGGIAPRSLMPESSSQVAGTDAQEKSTLSKDGLDVTIGPGAAGYPGVVIKQAGGAAWNLTPFGRVEARITNTGLKPLTLILRVDNAGPWQTSPWSTESMTIKPGQAQTMKVYFGYSNGGKPSYKLNPGAINELLVMNSGKVTQPVTFRITEIWASGSSGEKPPVDPNTVKIKPENGVIYGAGVTLDPVKQLAAVNGATASVDPTTKALQIAFAGKVGEAVSIKPPMGAWSLTDYNEIKVMVRNNGTSVVNPGVNATGSGTTDTAHPASPLAPGATAEIAVSFVPAVPAKLFTPARLYADCLTKGTGTTFASDNVKSITVFSDGTPGAKSLQVLSITADAPAAELPSWLGQKPPVDGDWVKTFDDEFDGSSIDMTKWNIYTVNFWDKRTHFAKDNLIMRDGKMILHYEKKTGHQADNPTDKETDYACGYADTFGKWVQRYGYFEARMKLPRAPGLWPCFWLMPDRGIAAGPQWKRGDTANGGMEFDIIEFLSGWGPYHYNIAQHWDGYGSAHKACGSAFNYAQADKDGYVTCGLLWTPGKVVYYCNGREQLEWESPRVSTIQSYIIFNMVSGGWANLPLDDTKLPDDFVVDYVRVWQRKDLASDVDGPKPNNGGPTPPVAAAAAK